VLRAAEFLAVFATGLFAGAALYVNLAEHPARMSRDTRVALEVWAPSYVRATRMQAPLAIAGLLCGCLAWLAGGGALWLVAGLLIGSVVPFTLLIILPTNHALLAPGRDAGSSETRRLLTRWGNLHAVRTVLGLLALALMAWRLVSP
jgi:uncharacterized membrane protein